MNELNGYRNITFWESLRRQERLNEFLELLDTYFLAQRAGQVEQAGEARTSLNLILVDVSKILYAANIDPVIGWTPPPMHGGPSQRIDIVANLFNLDRFFLTPDYVFDVVLQAQGVYESNHFRSFLRTFNPFWWVFRVFNWVATLPFLLLGSAGFNSEQAERSAVGRLIKVVILMLSVSATFLTVLSHLGLLQGFLELIENIANRT